MANLGYKEKWRQAGGELRPLPVESITQI